MKTLFCHSDNNAKHTIENETQRTKQTHNAKVKRT